MKHPSPFLSARWCACLFLAVGLHASTHAAVPSADVEQRTYDLVVAGATPSGIVCAVRAAREGLNVLLINHAQHVGGFMTSGGGGWEAPYDGARSPLYDEILRKITAYYRDTYGEGSPQHLASLPDLSTDSRLGRPKVEPRVAELIFERLLADEPRITVIRGFYPASAEREDNLLRAVTFREMHGARRLRIAGRNFADCMYEGDLAAVAGVPWRVGREARSDYNEPHAGVIFAVARPKDSVFHKRPKIDVRKMGPSNGVEILMPESTGEGDRSVMAYNYRLILTKKPGNRIMVSKPEGYDPAILGDGKPSIVPDLPNDKIAWNGGGRLLGPQNAYPEGDWTTREEISRRYLNAAIGRLWFYQNDPAASAQERGFWKDYGLAKDEFVDNSHVPYEVYVREARRIIGRYVFTEHDALVAPGIERAPIQSDSVAITDWPLDLAACTDRMVRGKAYDGKLIVADVWRPAQVPYRTLLVQGLDNLLVPQCLSSTHVGWGTIRLEPVWMQTGEAAAYAIALAHRHHTWPALIDSDKLLRTLVQARTMVSFFNDTNLASPDATLPAVQYFGTKGFFSTHDARPAAPLTESVARAWLATFEKLARRDAAFDPTAEARALPPASAEDGGPAVSADDFLARINAIQSSVKRSLTPLPAGSVPPGTPLSRGKACALLYDALVERPL
ncbi:MAG: protein-xanthan lyase [Rariglobus sp.]|jgi:hypothetical protein|nr:protein-xanthan lyase [Rariglobus sp.]